MTDPTPTRAEAEADLHRQSMDMMTKLAAENQALRERAEAADRDRSRLYDALAAAQTALTEARRAEAAAWNDAIEAAALEASTWLSADDSPILREHIRALRRAAPTEGET